jgi:hypothetical protein
MTISWADSISLKSSLFKIKPLQLLMMVVNPLDMASYG